MEGTPRELIRMFLPYLPEGERFIRSFPDNRQGRVEAGQLSKELLECIRGAKAGKRIKVLVQTRPHIGRGVWLVVEGEQKGHSA